MGKTEIGWPAQGRWAWVSFEGRDRGAKKKKLAEKRMFNVKRPGKDRPKAKGGGGL